jgi:hypothetical protein
MNDDIKKIIEEELHLGALPPEAREKVFSVIGEKVMKQIIIDVYQYVPEAQIKEIDAKVDAGDVEGLVVYLETHVPQSGVIIQESAKKVIADFKKALAN